MNTYTWYKRFVIVMFLTTASLTAVQDFEADWAIYNTDSDASTWDDLAESLTRLRTNLKDYLHEKRIFLKRFIEKHKQVGAVAPSSRFLADKMTEHLKQYSEPITIIEVGAGTGVFTEKIIERMPAGSTLHVVEIDPDFYAMLEAKFGDIPNVHIHCADILTVKLPNADCIISGLPFNAFSPEFVDNILKKYKRLVKTGGSIVYFEYAWLPKLKALWLEEEECREYKRLRKRLARFRNDSASTDSNLVLLNLPPAHVITCCC